MDNVSFAYDGDLAVLHDVSLEVSPGETVAIVGPSGGGKTTLCQLIPRFYEVTSGSIAIDGVSLTVASITGPDELEFWITPHTWERTIMHCYTPGSIVDIEVDMIAKYVEKLKIHQ